MQTLGLSDSTLRTEGRLKGLFWPTIQSAADVDYTTRQGFWLCVVLGVATWLLGVFQGEGTASLIDFVFYFLCGVGIRQRSRVAAGAVLLVYLVGTILVFRAGNPGFTRFIFLALLLSNLRALFLVSRFPIDDFIVEPHTLADRFSTNLPPKIWGWAKYVLYILFVLEIIGLAMLLNR